MKVISKAPIYTPMSLEQRKALLPKRNVCSLTPAKHFGDAVITGNGRQRIDVLGDPYEDTVAFTHERLYEPKWDKTPEPPNLIGILPEVRRLLRESQFEDAAKLVDSEQRKQGFDRYLRTEADGSIFPPTSLRQHQAFWLTLRQDLPEKPENYLRYLDILSGECVVAWDTSKGSWRRRSLVSFRHDIVAQEISAPGNSVINLELIVTLPTDAAQNSAVSLTRFSQLAHCTPSRIDGQRTTRV